MIHDVLKFHEKFNLPDGSIDILSGNPEALEFRQKFMQEELDEFKQAMESGDRVKAFDALLDLVYVAHGTALFMGITPDMWAEGHDAVQHANMSKVRAESKEQSASSSGRGSTFDVIKPEGWEPPEPQLEAILNGV